jgi:hypothetical protein
MAMFVGEPPTIQLAVTVSTPDPASLTVAEIVALWAVPGGQDRNGSSSSQMAPGLAVC